MKNVMLCAGAGRSGTADKAANAAELLMSGRGAFITGSAILMDGGAASSYFYEPLKPQAQSGNSKHSAPGSRLPLVLL